MIWSIFLGTVIFFAETSPISLEAYIKLRGGGVLHDRQTHNKGTGPGVRKVGQV
ncbi:MAG: hypothetical protein ABIJ97_08530 [Bacteroidota bacterium]